MPDFPETYYNQLDENASNYNRNLDYSRLLFLPGGVLQSNEMNVMQSAMHRRIKGVAEAMLTNGDIVYGCDINLTEYSNQLECTISSGAIYMNGAVHEKKTDTTLSTRIPKVGTYCIVAYVSSSIVSSGSELNDPALSDYGNSGQRGAPRLLESLDFRVEENAAGIDGAILYTIKNGELMNAKKANSEDAVISKLNNTLARRTYDTEGNYKVDGLDLSVSPASNFDTSDGTRKKPVRVSSGKAYVLGYEILKLTDSNVLIECNPVTSSDTANFRRVENESFLVDFQEGTSFTYNVAHAPICVYEGGTTNIWNSSLLRLTGIELARETFPSYDGQQSTITLNSTVDAGGKVFVQQGNGDIVRYYAETDADKPLDAAATIQTISSSTNTITFLSPGTYPTAGTITVYYTRTHSLTYGHGWEITNNGSTILLNKEWSGNGQSTFLYNGVYTVDYCYPLCRKDVIAIKSDGELISLQGVPSEREIAETPICNSNDCLPLGVVLYDPSQEGIGDIISVSNNNTKAIKMLDNYRMLQRIADLEYNLAATALDHEAASGESEDELIGIFTDGFTLQDDERVTSKMDNSKLGETERRIAIDPDTSTITTSSAIQIFEYDTANNPPTNSFTLPFALPAGRNQIVHDVESDSGSAHDSYLICGNDVEKEAVVSQLNATGEMRINPYAAFPKTPVLSISPATNSYSVTRVRDANTGVTVSDDYLTRAWETGGNDWTAAQQALWQRSQQGTTSNVISSSSRSQTVSTTTVTAQALSTEGMTMPQTDIAVEVSNVEPNSRHVNVTFDGVDMSVFDSDNPNKQGLRKGKDRNDFAQNYASSSVKYNQEDSSRYLIADSNGVATGHFTIPENIPLGSVEVRAFETGSPGNFGSATYTASMRLTEKVVQTTVQTYSVDPLAQSFMLSENRIISGVGLWFSAFGNSAHNIKVQLRPMVNGYPSNEILAETSMRITGETDTRNKLASFVSGGVVGEDGLYYQNEQVFEFNKPVICYAGTQYCFTVMSANTSDALLVATTGERMKDVPTGYDEENAIVTINPYLDGVLFSSSNAFTWTAHQNSDIMFKLYAYKFDEDSETTATFTEFGQSIVDNADEEFGETPTYDRFVIAAQQLNPSGLPVQWEYSLDGANWRPTGIYSDAALKLTRETFGSLHIRVKIKSDSEGKMSPIINLSSISVTLFKQRTTGTYISKRVSVPSNFNGIRVIIDIKELGDSNALAEEQPSVKVYYTTDTSNETWTEIPNVERTEYHTDGGATSRILGTGYVERTYTKKLADAQSSFRVKLTLSTPTQKGRINVGRLRCILKEILE